MKDILEIKYTQFSSSTVVSPRSPSPSVAVLSAQLTRSNAESPLLIPLEVQMSRPPSPLRSTEYVALRLVGVGVFAVLLLCGLAISAGGVETVEFTSLEAPSAPVDR